MDRPKALSFLLLAAGIALAAPMFCQQSKQPCLVDKENYQVNFPACALSRENGADFVPVNYLKRFEFNQYGLAWLRFESGGYVYFNRSGRIVIRDVFMMDNGADYFHRGMVRLERNGKYGLADFKGHIVVPIQYDGAGNSDEDGPEVIVGCKLEHDGEHSQFVGGDYFKVDREGHLSRKPSE